jgi:hypothetical protein
MDYNTIWAYAMVTHVTSYNIGWRCNFVSLRGYHEFWGRNCILPPKIENMSYRKVSLLMKFIRGQVGKSNKSTILVGFLGFSHGCELLENNTHVQDVPSNGKLVMLRPHIWDSTHSSFYIGS